MYLKELLPETEPKVDAIGERLLKAAQIIRERGWCQGQLRHESGAVCAMGAIEIAAYFAYGPMGLARDRLTMYLLRTQAARA